MKHAIKTLALIVGIAMLSIQARAQITLDHVYPNASLKLYMVDLELSGMKYLVKTDDSSNRFIKLYNLNHSLWKTINCNTFPTTLLIATNRRMYNYDALYVSETLFDCDSAVEFLYVSNSGYEWFTGIYKENGTAVFIADSCAPLVKLNIPQQFRPIYNTPGGTKLILSHRNGNAMVYNLPCNLSSETGISGLPNPAEAGFNVYPNPSSSRVIIDYKIPYGFTQGEIRIMDINGREVKRYTVDNTFSNITIGQNELSAGAYLYSFIVGNQCLVSKKVIVAK